MKYMGQVYIVKAGCGHVTAACWIDGNEKDAELFKRRHVRAGRYVEKIDRHEGDDMPVWCNSTCPRMRPELEESHEQLG